MSKFDEAEFRRAIERVGAGQGNGDPAPAFDPRLRKDVAAEAIKGRKIGDYKQALEAHGFRFVPAHRLRPYPDGSKHESGEWRCDAWRCAFTEEDVLSLFPDGPGQFYNWFSKLKLQRRAARAGIVVP